MKLGFIGLGIMGSGMARNLAKHHQVLIYNRTREKANDIDAEIADSPEHLAEQVDILFTMLANPKAVEEMAEKFLPSMKEGSIWVDCSTNNPEFSRRMAKKANGLQIRYVDAPVGGSKQHAEDAKLMFYVGAEEEDFSTIKPLLDCMGAKAFLVGLPGMGSSLKLANNLIAAQSIIALSESMKLAQSFGISKEQYHEILNGMAIMSPLMQWKANKILKDDYEAEFPLELMHKDAKLIIDEARLHNLKLEQAESCEKIYAKAKEKYARQDFSAVYKE